jgi:putative membrane protein
VVKLLIRLLINAFALWVAARLVPDIDLTNVWWQVLIVAAVFGLVNALIKPVVKLFSLPLLVVTLGLFTLIINLLLFWLTDLLIGEWLSVGGFFDALFGSIIVSVVSWLLSLFLSDD